MSRWNETFEKHNIHHRLSQLDEWTNEKFDGLDSEVATELRRFRKTLKYIQDVVAGLDAEFLPETELNQLEKHLNHQHIWQGLSTFSSNPNITAIRNANNQISGKFGLVYQLAALHRGPEAKKSVKEAEAAFDSFCKAVDKYRASLQERVSANDKEITELDGRLTDLKVAHVSLVKATEASLGEWQTEHTEAQNTRATEFSDAQIKRTEAFEEKQREWSLVADTAQKDILAKFHTALTTGQTGFDEAAKLAKEDIEKKHRAIQKVHDLAAGDVVAGGYKKGAEDEGRAADQWRKTAMWAFVAAAIWTLVKVGAYWLGWVSTSPGNTDWAEIIAGTSLTLILLATAGYAARQSKLHRVAEQKMSWFALEVTALDPFIASLTEDQQRVLKVQLSQKLFGQNHSAARAAESNVDPEAFKTITEAVMKPAQELVKLAGKTD